MLTAVITCCSWLAFAQFSLHGQVSDGVEFLPGVNVMLFRDSTLACIARTDSLGRYVLKGITAGTYRITCSLVGYNTFVSALVLKGVQYQVEIPEILMKESTFQLGAVEITSSRVAVDQQLDRLVIRPAEAITYSGNSVLEVLQKSPGVLINRQTGTISVGGRSGVRILINHKPVQVSAEVVLQMLDGMSAAQVERIELIAVPSSGYDAEGAAGIINIITRKDSELGTNGSMTATVGAHWAETLGFSGNVNRRTPRFAYFLDYSVLYNHNQHVMQMYRETQAGDALITSTDDSPRENVTTQQNLRAGVEWYAGKRWMFNLQMSGYSRDWRLNARAYNTATFNGDSIRQTNLIATESNVWRSATGSLGLQHQVNARRRIDVAIDYLYYHNHNPSDYMGEMPDADQIKLSKQTPIQFVVATAQYVSYGHPATFSWDAGVKAAFSSFDNQVHVQRLKNGVWTDDNGFTSRSTMEERILAAYISTVWKAGMNWEVIAGLRYEHTHTIIEVVSNQRLVRQYGNLFPQLSIRRRLPGGDEFYFGYSRRITRPTYNDMAPYVFFWSADSFSSGNTFLLPALSNSVTAGLRHGSWGWVALHSQTTNAIAQMQPEIVEEAALVYRSQNLGILNTWSLATSYSAAVHSWWDVRGELALQCQRAKILNLPVHSDRALWGMNVNVHSIFKLPREFSVELSALYQSRSLSGISDFLPYGSLDAAIARRLGRSGTLRLSIDDILYTNLWRIRTSSPDNNLNVRFDYDWHNRFVRLAYTWTLGNTKVPSIKSMPGSEDERRRVNP